MAYSSLDKSKRIDLMYKTIKFVGARKKNGSGKFPTLIELYWKLFEKSFPAHDAGEDVKATKRCYDELVKMGMI
jgi:DNA polymerase-3 subunit alpha